MRGVDPAEGQARTCRASNHQPMKGHTSSMASQNAVRSGSRQAAVLAFFGRSARFRTNGASAPHFISVESSGLPFVQNGSVGRPPAGPGRRSRQRIFSMAGDKLVRSSLFLTSNKVGGAILAFVFWFVVARIFTPEQVGIATSLINSAGMIAFLSMCGLDITIIRFHSSGREPNALVTQSLAIVSAVAAVMAAGYVMLVPYYEPSLGFVRSNILYAVGLVAGSVLGSISMLTDAVFIAMRKTECNLYINCLLHGLARMVLLFLLTGLGAYGIFGSTIVAYLIVVVGSLLYLTRATAFRFDFRLRGGIPRHQVGYSASGYVASVFAMAPRMILPLIALHSLGNAGAGYYYLTFQMATIIYWLATGAGEALLSEGAFDESQLPRLLRRSAILSMALIIPSVLVLWLAGPDLLSLFGHDYVEHGSELVSVLALGALPVTLTTWGGFLLRLTGQMRSLVLSSFACAAVSMGLAEVWAQRGLVWLGWAWFAGNMAGAVLVLAALAAHYRSRARRHGVKISGSQHLRKAGDNARMDSPTLGDRRDAPGTQFPGAQPQGSVKPERWISNRRVCSAPDKIRFPTAARPVEFRHVNGGLSVPAAATPLCADVVICTYTLARWDLLAQSVESALAQRVAPQRLIIVVDHNQELLEQCRQEWAGRRPNSTVEILVVANQFAGRLGSARNTALLYARADIVAFLDDDAEAASDWLERLLAVYATHPGAVAVGGAPRPNYGAPRPSWFPPDCDWVFGCHYGLLPDRLAPVRHLIGANMSVRRDAILAVGGFHADDHDDMDLSHRIAHTYGLAAVCYEPRAEVRHYVSPERLTWSYFWRRCFYVNRSKVGAFADMGEAGNIGAELRFGVRVLLRVGPALVAALSGRPERLVQALVAVVGLVLAGSGYVAGRAQLARGRRAEILTTGLSAVDVERARVAVPVGDDA
jgi:glucosyl-dolichyl phosphate glucuronosyltransferase